MAEDRTGLLVIARRLRPARTPTKLQAIARWPYLDCRHAGQYHASMFIRVILIAFIVLSLAGPSSGNATPPPGNPAARLIPVKTPSGTVVQAEIADTPQKRAAGLMYRDHLKKDHGMMFFFDQAQEWTFWMKNTLIALDLIWMDDKKRVIHIERNVPICTRTDDSCPQYRPNDGAMYVLEIAAGTADGLKIEKGTKLQFANP
ncbi:MAG: DUF192 domain-containing protein [Nitrospirota bacterium]